MPTNPQDLTDLVKVSILIVQGSQPTGSVARALLVSEFAATAAFPTRQKRYSGTPADIDAALAADGFTAPYDPGDDMSTARAMAAAFLDNELPVDEVVIGRKDAADASYTAALNAIDAEDNTFCLVAAETRTKNEQLQIADWCESRWRYYRTLSREPGVPAKQVGTFVDAAFVKKYHHTSATWYDAEIATGYGPAIVLSGAGTFLIEDGMTFSLNVSGGVPQTVTFATAPATVLGANVGPFVLVAGTTIVVELDGVELIIPFEDDPEYFPAGIGAATTAQVVDYLSDKAPSITWEVDANAVRATTQRSGTDASLDFTGGAAAIVLGLNGLNDTGSGDFAYADAATSTEIAAKITALPPVGFTASAVGTKLKLQSVAEGETVYLELLESTALANLGLEVGKFYGTGVTEDWHDCAVLGVLAQLAARLDTPGGSFPLDNQKLRGRPGMKLSPTERKGVQEQFCDTYEMRTQNFPGEIHFGVSFSGVNADFVVFSLWLQLRTTEAVKALQDSYAQRKQRIPYDDDGIARVDNVIVGVLTLGGASGALRTPIDLTPYDPLFKVTGYKKPLIAEQSAANRAAGRVSGWRTTQIDAGSIKAVEIEFVLTTP